MHCRIIQLQILRSPCEFPVVCDLFIFIETNLIGCLAVFNTDLLQVCDFSEGPSQRPPGALAEWRPRLQLSGWVLVREWTISCEHADVLCGCNCTE